MVTLLSEVEIVSALEVGGYEPFGRDPQTNIFAGDYRSDRLGKGLDSIDGIEWLHPTDPKPTEQQILDWENTRLNILATHKIDSDAIQAELNDYAVNQARARLAIEIISELTKTFLDGQNPSTTSVYAAFVTRLNGSDLESAIKNYVTMITGLTSFGTSIPIAEKQSIMLHAKSFLSDVIIIWQLRGKNRE